MAKKGFTPNYLLNQINWLRKWSLNLAGIYLMISMVLDYFRFPYEAHFEVFTARLVYMVLPVTLVLLAFYFQIKFKINRSIIELTTFLGVVVIGVGHTVILMIAAQYEVFFPKIGITIILVYVGLLLALRIPLAMLGSTILIGQTCYVYSQTGMTLKEVMTYFSFLTMFSSCCILTNLACIRILKSNLKLIKNTNIQAITDELTQLYNRRYFYQESEVIYSQAVRAKKSLALIMVDLDNFKQINDFLGHKYGDNLLIEFSKILKKMCQRPLDLAARLGGDEFVLILYDSTEEHIHDVCKEIILEAAYLSNVLAEKDKRTDLGVSIGVSSNKHNEVHPVKLLMEVADEALYKVKAQGKNAYEFGDKNLYTNVNTSSNVFNTIQS